MRGAWIEIFTFLYQTSLHYMSRPMRGAWIEISFFYTEQTPHPVAPHAGRVD